MRMSVYRYRRRSQPDREEWAGVGLVAISRRKSGESARNPGALPGMLEARVVESLSR